ncbi:hypothetical protein DJ68_11215 [Halorubrum sp. C3]|nr:hypothetical protein DJ68_11215 [Halorubrum sp. C3]
MEDLRAVEANASGLDPEAVHEEGNRIVVELVPTLEELHGNHAGDHEPGEVIAMVRKMDEEERRREEEEVQDLVERHGGEQ